jgi:hypothetical protein
MLGFEGDKDLRPVLSDFVDAKAEGRIIGGY